MMLYEFSGIIFKKRTTIIQAILKPFADVDRINQYLTCHSNILPNIGTWRSITVSISTLFVVLDLFGSTWETGIGKMTAE